ncbi:MAG: YcjF family protein [Rhodospirillaceae bacterium]
MAEKPDDTTATAADAPETDAPEADAAVEETSKKDEALKLVRRFSYWGIGASAIPVMVVDTAALLAVQLRMVQKLSEHYEVEFKENVVKSVITAVAGSTAAGIIGHSVVGRVLGGIPTVGPVLKLASAPVVGGAFTYAVGKMFTEHFESGGTLLTLDTAKAKLRCKKIMEEESSSSDDAAAQAAA